MTKTNLRTIHVLDAETDLANLIRNDILQGLISIQWVHDWTGRHRVAETEDLDLSWLMES